MKTWIKSVWVKRLVPLVLLAAIWSGYRVWQSWQESARLAETDRLGSVVAEVWIGTAKYRHDPARYLGWRDSLLKARGVTREELEAYVAKHADETQEYYDFSLIVARKVDSLYKIEDSVIRARKNDSTKSSGTVADSTVPVQKRMGSVPSVPRQK
jgi:hypothetical protein